MPPSNMPPAAPSATAFDHVPALFHRSYGIAPAVVTSAQGTALFLDRGAGASETCPFPRPAAWRTSPGGGVRLELVA
jgi:hypothetical protein